MYEDEYDKRLNPRPNTIYPKNQAMKMFVKTVTMLRTIQTTMNKTTFDNVS